MSIASQITRINTNIAAAYDEAEAKGATMPATENSANLAQTVASIPEAVQPTLITKQITANGTYAAEDDNADGYSEVTVNVPIPTPVEEKDVNFYDYDGTLLYSYKKSEALALTELPEAPTHEKLSTVGWAYTLQQVKDYAQYDDIKVNVLCQYQSPDGDTHLFGTITDSAQLEFDLYLQMQAGTLNISINSQPYATETETSTTSVSHTVHIAIPSPQYFPFQYEMVLSYNPASNARNCFIGQGAVATRLFGIRTDMVATLEYLVLGLNMRISSYGMSYFFNLKNIIFHPTQQLYFGEYCCTNCPKIDNIVVTNFRNGFYWFENCSNITTINFTAQTATIPRYCFRNCDKLNNLIIPSGFSIDDSVFGSEVGLTSAIDLSNYSFGGCTSLFTIYKSNTFTLLHYSAFTSCRSLARFIIPKTVTSIGARAFNTCTSLIELDLSAFDDPTSLPLLQDVLALGYTPSNQIIYVKNQEMLDAFTVATNWSTYADRFQIKE